MNTDTIANLQVCSTCLIYIAYGDGDPEWTGDELAEYEAAVDARWDGWVLVPGDSDEGRDFSWSSCDGCGDHRGGDRHHAVAFLP